MGNGGDMEQSKKESSAKETLQKLLKLIQSNELTKEDERRAREATADFAEALTAGTFNDSSFKKEAVG
jgi:hypothetical protein